MLKQRVATALVLITVALAALLHSDPVYWRLLINIIVFIAFWEWLGFCGISSPSLSALSCGLFVAVMYFIQNKFFQGQVIIYSACLIWLTLLVFTLSNSLQFFHHTIVKMFLGVAILASAAWVVIELRYLPNGIGWVICYLLAVFAADIGAYFVGRRFGKTKLAPQISPAKTVEGVVGGVALAALIFVPVLYSNFSSGSATLLLITVLVTSLISVGGDLFESKMKRHVGLKDSSKFLPGHGGVLDRIDSLIAAAPFFMLGLSMLGYVA